MPETETQDRPASPWPQGSSSPHASPLISGLDPSNLPVPFPACGDCPAAIWYGTVVDLRCFCKAINKHSWGTEEFDPNRDAVISCDAREMAIEQLEAKLAEQAGAMG